jgi:hypothetical protein
MAFIALATPSPDDPLSMGGYVHPNESCVVAAS